MLDGNNVGLTILNTSSLVGLTNSYKLCGILKVTSKNNM